MRRHGLLGRGLFHRNVRKVCDEAEGIGSGGGGYREDHADFFACVSREVCRKALGIYARAFVALIYAVENRLFGIDPTLAADSGACRAQMSRTAVLDLGLRVCGNQFCPGLTAVHGVEEFIHTALGDRPTGEYHLTAVDGLDGIVEDIDALDAVTATVIESGIADCKGMEK